LNYEHALQPFTFALKPFIGVGLGGGGLAWSLSFDLDPPVFTEFNKHKEVFLK